MKVIKKIKEDVYEIEFEYLGQKTKGIVSRSGNKNAIKTAEKESYVKLAKDIDKLIDDFEKLKKSKEAENVKANKSK